jgi:hypothetical protein
MLISILAIYYITSMNPEEKSTLFLQKRLLRLQQNVNALFPLMRGAVVSIGVKKRPTYSLNMNGKTKIVSLGGEKELVAKKLIANYRKLQDIVDEMTLINIELIRRMEDYRKKSA